MHAVYLLLLCRLQQRPPTLVVGHLSWAAAILFRVLLLSLNFTAGGGSRGRSRSRLCRKTLMQEDESLTSPFLAAQQPGMPKIPTERHPSRSWHVELCHLLQCRDQPPLRAHTHTHCVSFPLSISVAPQAPDLIAVLID